ncbi:hypothetical protein BGZ76_006236, partial [Entomortierella beljakovae]
MSNANANANAELEILSKEYLNARQISDISAIDFFQFHEFPLRDSHKANTAWSKVVISTVEQLNGKRGAALRAEWESSKHVRAAYWKSLDEKEKMHDHQNILKDHARRQIQAVSKVIDQDVDSLVEAELN